jgi:hypothetical protein
MAHLKMRKIGTRFQRWKLQNFDISMFRESKSLWPLSARNEENLRIAGKCMHDRSAANKVSDAENVLAIE